MSESYEYEMNTKSSPELESADRRAALKAIRKYATVGAGASIVVLSSADAVKAQATSQSNACSRPNPPPKCDAG